MKSKNMLALILALPLIGIFHGCASNSGGASASNTSSEEKVEKDDYSKAARKISQAIGEETDNFKIVSRVEGDSAPAGFSEGIYTVQTNGGTKYKCSILEPSGFMNAMSFGGAGSAAAMCTNFTAGSKDQGKTNKASCNDLLRAAGKC